LPRFSTPALVFTRRGPDIGRTSEERARRVASLLPNARCVEIDAPAVGLFSRDGSTPRAVIAIEEFLSEIPVPRAHPEGAGLSPREIEVLRLLAAGRTNAQIADDLVISLNTVRRHVSNIFDKTESANRTEAAVYAKERGLA
jgi:DNA-binding NarL/FixJ family response regulator